ERNLDLTEAVRCGEQPVGVAGRTRAQALDVCVHERRAASELDPVGEGEELFRLRGLAECERGLERVDDAVLHALERRTENLGGFERAQPRGESIFEPAFRSEQRRLR